MLRVQPFLLLAIALLLLGGAASAQTEFPVAVTQSANIQSNGPKQGATAERYFNVEGKSHDKFSDYGVLRFETKSLKADADKKFGAGKWKITGVLLHMTQSNAAFTKDGTVDIYYSADDKADVKTAASPLKYPYSPKGEHLKGELIGKGTFAKADAKATPPPSMLSEFDLLKSQPGQKDMLAALSQGKTVTLIVAEADPAVAATWSAKGVALAVKAVQK